MTVVTFTLNGQPVTVHSDPATPLLDVLRNELGVTGAKQGCDHEGECGACTVLLDGESVRSCLTPVGKVAGRHVATVEGLGSPDKLHPLQRAFIEAGAVQCGYCTPGMLMASKSLLDRELNPSREQIIEALEGNICRCTGYTRIVAAVEMAASWMRGEEASMPLLTDKPPVGGNILRADSIDKVTGRAQYVEDIAMPGTLVGRVLRSPYHHARLMALDVEPALAVPGVICALTEADIPGLNSFVDYSQEETVLPPVGATLRIIGAPVALIVAETEAAAQAGLDAICVEYEELPHTFDIDEALAPGAVHIAGDDNQLTTFDLHIDDAQSVLEQSDVVLEATYDTAYLEHSALERETLLGYYDEAGRLTVTGGTHEPHYKQDYIHQSLDLPLEQVRVIMPPTGGTFGGKQDPWPFIATALMTYHTKRPVQLVYSRRESFDVSPKRHPYRVAYRIGANENGSLTAIKIWVDVNTGGYDAHGQYISNYAVTAGGGPYRWQAVDGFGRSIYTNGPKAGQFRGFGTSQSTFALECAMDELAGQLGIDPIEFRLMNTITQEDRCFLGYPVAETLGYREVLEAVRPHYQAWQEASEAFNAAQGDGPLRQGVGIGGMWYRFGKSGSLSIEAHAELALDGHFIVYCSAPDYGQGTNTAMSQMAADALGVPREQIELINADTARVPDSGIQGASRAVYFVGGAVRSAATTLRQEIMGVAAEMLDVSPGELTLAFDRVVSRDGAHSVALDNVAHEFETLAKSRRIVDYFDLSPHFPAETRPEYIPLFVTGAHVAWVQVNMETGAVQVLKMAAAHDVGRAINPLDTAGQIEGAVVMGLGSALMEEVIPGRTTGFSDYYLPTARSMPEISVHLVEVPSYQGPLGVKGVGEAAMLPTAPAIINAVSRVIGKRLRSIPATPERVLAAIQSRAAERVG